LLAAELPGGPGGFLLEYRPAQGWDAGFPRSAVFVHRLEDGRSYRMTDQSGQSDLVVGDSFGFSIDLPFMTAHSTATVDEIDDQRLYARITLSHRSTVRTRGGLVGLVLGGIEVDGGGVFVVGGVPHPVPPWNPFTAVLEQLAAYRAADMIADPITQIQAKKVALSAILDTVGQQLGDLTGLESPPPPAELR
jgi:hypothetical protein